MYKLQYVIVYYNIIKKYIYIIATLLAFSHVRAKPRDLRDTCFVKALKDLEAGEALYINYGPAELLGWALEVRQEPPGGVR